MASGLFTLRNQLQALVQKAWIGKPPITYSGEFSNNSILTTSTSLLNYSTSSPSTATFTIDAWVYVTQFVSAGNIYWNQCILSKGNVYLNFGVNGSGNLIFYHYDGSARSVTSSTTISANTWTYVAVTVTGSTVTLYINGTSVGTGTWYGIQAAGLSTNCYSGLAGAFTSGSQYFYGAISNLRVSSIARTITTPTAPFTSDGNTQLLTLQSSTIFDASSNAYSITNQSVDPSNINPFNIPYIAAPAVEYLVVAGGGAGGSNSNGGGGGAGGLLQGVTSVTNGSSITVTVGAGGTGVSTGGATGGSGSNSVLGSITAIGGGGGSASSPTPPAGGSGGGGAAAQFNYPLLGAQGIAGQGNAGGYGTPSGTIYYTGGGGGGAGTVGLNGTTVGGGNGGAGIASSINGTVTAYAGGGGGGTQSSSSYAAGVGGVGGGGSGVKVAGAGGSGTANTGGGGGGASDVANNTPGGNGGSGIVIISYPDTYNAPSALTGTYTASTSGSGSISLNGSSQYITYSPNAVANLSSGTTGNYTVEAWVYLTATPAGNAYNNVFPIISTIDSVGSGLYQVYAIGSTGYFIANRGSTGYLTLSGTIPSLNTWAHVAFVNVGTTMTVYLNGVSVASTSATGTWTSGGVYTSVGWNRSAYFQGYISNLRTVANTAVYTSNFTPATAPLTPITNTTILLNTVSPSGFNDSSTNAYAPTANGSPTWSQLSPFATGLGYKNRVYTWTGSGTITF